MALMDVVIAAAQFSQANDRILALKAQIVMAQQNLTDLQKQLAEQQTGQRPLADALKVAVSANL